MNLGLYITGWVPYAIGTILSIGFSVLVVTTVRRERRGEQGRLTSEVLLPLAIVCIFISPLIASFVTPDWSPWSMGGVTLVLWSGSGFSAVYLWRQRKGDSEVRSGISGVVAVLLMPLILAVMGIVWLLAAGIGGSVFGS